jgi:glycosyltransferase involved in cell wall biosynthesis
MQAALLGRRAVTAAPLGEDPDGPGTTSPLELEVVVPAFNEEARIGETLGALLAFLDAQPWASAVVVVDNGSVDRTSEIVDRAAGRRTPVRVIGCADQGKGAAVRRGVLTTTARWVGFCDADLSTPVETLARIVPLLRWGRPVVIGSRRCPGGRYLARQPLSRRIGGGVFRLVAAEVCAGVADTQCGFKFFQGDVARALFARSRTDGFAFDLEVVALAQQAGLGVTEVPVEWADAAGSTVRFTQGLLAILDAYRLRHELRRREPVEALAEALAEPELVPALAPAA